MVPANCQGSLMKYWGGGDNVAMDQHSIEGQVVILLITLGNRNKLCLKGQLGLRTDFALLLKILSFWLL